ncbi:MAG: flagellar biosynthesis protein FlgH [Candidatus Rokuibacteriota bacterium]|nr:MAG: flagellar biosynthesis protein FlgH [Candidatus Rokubacteria bacterium]
MSARSVFRSRTVVRGAAVWAAVVVWAAPAMAQSLWTVRSGSLVSDVKARAAGDLVTILIDETTTAEKSAGTDLKRDSAFASTLVPPHFEKPDWLKKILVNMDTSGTGKSNYTGDGKTSRTDKATATITTRVTRVLDNGNLVLEGRRLVKVNEETQTLVISGIVRPYDVNPDNTVASSRIADGEVRIEGQGTVSDRQKPGLFQRFFDFLGLF